MQGVVYIPGTINEDKFDIVDTLKSYSFNVFLDNNIDKIHYIDTFSNHYYIDPTCNGLDSKDNALEDVVVLLRKIICLGAIDGKIQEKEFKKNKAIFFKAYVYIQLKNHNIDIKNLDEISDYMHLEYIKAISKRTPMNKRIALLYNAIMSKKIQIHEQKVSQDIILEEDELRMFMSEIDNDYILIDKFDETLKLSYETKKEFEKGLANSLSLDKKDKIGIVEQLDTLTTFQINSLIKVFTDEQKKFFDLSKQKKNEQDIINLKKESEDIWNYIKENIDIFVSLKSPKRFYELMSEYIIGQDDALKKIANSLYHHKVAVSQKMHDINFGPIIISGPTGSGKSFIVQTASKILNLDFLHVDCSTMVPEGIVGQGVQDIFKLLLNNCNYDMKRAKNAIIFLDEFDKLLLKENSLNIIAQLLRAIEGSQVNLTKSHSDHHKLNDIQYINTNNMFFVLGGSFEHILKEKRTNKSGFISQLNEDKLDMDEILSFFPRELSGRIKKVVSLRAFCQEDYYNILTKSKKSPLNDYKKIFSNFYYTDILFKEETLQEISKKASKSVYGARTLYKLVSNLCDIKLFEINKLEHKTIEF